jgi:vacuolar-type H+-ATPase subunit H
LPEKETTESPYPEGSVLATIGQEEERLLLDVDKAREKAAGIVASADREAEKILEDARATLPQLERELLQEAEPKMQKMRDEILAEAERKSAEMISRARSNLDTAVAAIVEGVLPVKEKNPRE